MASKKTLKVVDYEAVRAAFDEKFKETRQLIESGETHLDNLAEGFHEADEVIWSMPTIDAVPVIRCRDCKHNGLDCHHRPDWFCADGERKDG